MSETLAARAQAILHDWVQSESLRKHCYAVADSMKHFAQLRGEDVDLWEAVGLLHDMDYERHPNLERSATEGHPFVGVAWLRENGWSEEVCCAILSHADYSGVSPGNDAREDSLCGGRAKQLSSLRRARAPDKKHSRRLTSAQ
jgi:putative nucleotidyltransferase with HDIG domain